MCSSEYMGVRGTYYVPPVYPPPPGHRISTNGVRHTPGTITTIALGALIALAGVLIDSFLALGFGLVCILAGTYRARQRYISACTPVLFPARLPHIHQCPPVWQREATPPPLVPQYVPVQYSSERVQQDRTTSYGYPANLGTPSAPSIQLYQPIYPPLPQEGRVNPGDEAHPEAVFDPNDRVPIQQ